MKGKKGKKRLATASTDRRGLHSGQGLTSAYCLLKSNVGSNFSHADVLSPLWLRGPLPFGPYPHAPSLFRTAIAITFPLCLVPAREVFFLFFSLHLEPLQDNVNFDIAVAATNPPRCHLNTTATSPIP